MALVLSDALRHAERTRSAAEAVVCGDTRLTYADLAARSRRLAGALVRLGVRRGDRVAVLLPNCHRYLEAYFAVPGLGAVLVPLNTRASVPELHELLSDCDPRVLVIDEQYAERAAELDNGQLRVLTAPQQYEAGLAAASEQSLDGAGEADLAELCYTGGTTGRAKGVLLTQDNLVANAFNITIAFGYRRSDIYLHAAPMFHLADASSIYALTWCGARHVFLSTFDPAAVLSLIDREQVTCTIMIPAMLNAVVHHPRLSATNTGSLRLVAHGGAPIDSDALKQAAAALGCSFTQGYGLTESSALAAALPEEERLLDDPRLASVGQSVMGVELEVRLPDGSPCPPGEVGEVTGRGPNFSCGYWRREAETAHAMRSGWFWTGDLGRLDADGYLYLVDRANDMIISGGENVYSTEVEAVLNRHDHVLESAVVGVPDDVWGERVHAFVVLRPDALFDPEGMRSFCKQRLAGFKCPRSFERVEALPRSATGKLLKRDLRAPYWVGQAKQVH